MPPKRRDKGKSIAKDTDSQKPSKESQSTPSKEKLLSSAMPIKSWIEMVEDEEQKALSKSISSDQQVKEWMDPLQNPLSLCLPYKAFQNLKPFLKFYGSITIRKFPFWNFLPNSNRV